KGESGKGNWLLGINVPISRPATRVTAEVASAAAAPRAGSFAKVNLREQICVWCSFVVIEIQVISPSVGEDVACTDGPFHGNVMNKALPEIEIGNQIVHPRDTDAMVPLVILKGRSAALENDTVKRAMG